MRLARLGMGLLLSGSLVGPVVQTAGDAPKTATMEKIVAGVKGRARKVADAPFAFVLQAVVVGGHPPTVQNGLQQ